MSSAFSFPEENSFHFATKATTLARLRSRVTRASLCEQIIVPVGEWQRHRDGFLDETVRRFGGRPLAVRSSAADEDGWENSHAGAHLSLVDVEPTPEAIAAATDRVFGSYRTPSPEDQVLIQPMVENVVISGVVLTRDLDTGGPYYVVNYDDVTGRTDTVTSGAKSKTFLVHRTGTGAQRSPRFRSLIDAVIEIEAITGSEELDIEFCITDEQEVYILQVRPLAARQRWHDVPDQAIDTVIDEIRADISSRMMPVPTLVGATTILGEMPDWNPAEMIGTTPRPLSLSLYKYLITDCVWADARAVMGYRRVVEPLLVDFHGRPFIDTRASFNSFLPVGIGDDLAQRLVDYQVALLAERPEFHDKIEFEIAVTCRDFAFSTERQRLGNAGLSADDLATFEEALGNVTRAALVTVRGEMGRLLGQTDQLLKDRPEYSGLPPVRRAHRLFEDCKVLGTLPFSILARHGFIGILFLKSLVKRGVFDQADADRFMRGIHTVATDIVNDMHAVVVGNLEEGRFLSRHGHLRPGTYDITSWRYDERPNLFLGQARRKPPAPEGPFELTPTVRAGIEALLKEAHYELAPRELLDYISAAVKAREQAKFAFSRAISDALSALVEWGETKGISREDLSFLPIETILGEDDPGRLRERVAAEKDAYRVSRAIRLPHLICEPSDIDVVRLPLGQPTFITGRAVTAPSSRLTTGETPDITGRIILIESADPGFDWIFSHDIVGLITKFGGANSHMAIRSAEFGLPAAIGCGERLFEHLAKGAVIELNCADHRVTAR
jgi:glutamine kinase